MLHLKPVATGEVGALGVLTADEAGAAVGDQAQSTATGFGAAVAETGREFSSGGSGHVEIGLEVEFLRLALLQNQKKDASNTTIIMCCMNVL
jgi:hypothetical protein